MKRSPELTPLSRDHQHALAAAFRLRRAEPETLEEAIAEFHTFFEDEGRAHFAIEEQHILPALPADDAAWAPTVERVLDDHAWVRATAERLAGEGGGEGAAGRLAIARELGARLDAHVRFEERTQFPLLEERLSPAELAAVGERVAAAEAEAEHHAGHDR